MKTNKNKNKRLILQIFSTIQVAEIAVGSWDLSFQMDLAVPQFQGFLPVNYKRLSPCRAVYTWPFVPDCPGSLVALVERLQGPLTPAGWHQPWACTQNHSPFQANWARWEQKGRWSYPQYKSTSKDQICTALNYKSRNYFPRLIFILLLVLVDHASQQGWPPEVPCSISRGSACWLTAAPPIQIVKWE